MREKESERERKEKERRKEEKGNNLIEIRDMKSERMKQNLKRKSKNEDNSLPTKQKPIICGPLKRNFKGKNEAKIN